jgi:hypothetical protein
MTAQNNKKTNAVEFLRGRINPVLQLYSEVHLETQACTFEVAICKVEKLISLHKTLASTFQIHSH